MDIDQGIPYQRADHSWYWQLRVHACPVCGLACPCAKGWRVLDADRQRELTDLHADECDCPHDPDILQRIPVSREAP